MKQITLVTLFVLSISGCVTTRSASNPTVDLGSVEGCATVAKEKPIVSKCGYIYELRERIAAKWRYPESAKKAEQSGMVAMEFVIKKDGSLKSTRVLKSSGVPVLDASTISVITSAAPYPAFAGIFEKEEIVVTGNFRYAFD